MNKRKTILSLFSIFILIAISQIHGAYFNATRDLPDPEDIDGSMLVNIPPVEIAIASFQERLRKNPGDAVSYTLLGEQYIRQARETGDVSGYDRAELALRRGLELVPKYASARTSLASVYYARHEFSRSLDLALDVYEENYRSEEARLIAADSLLSLGRYEETEAIYNELVEMNPAPSLLARIANLAELRGESDEALELMRRAAGDALRSGGTRENIAWYLLRIGDLYFNRGEVEEAGDYYEASLRVFDGYHLALAGLGKVCAAGGEYEQAIVYYQQAVEVVPQPEFHAALGDLYMVTGEPDRAKIQYDIVEYIGKLDTSDRQIYNRQLATFYSDHNINLEEALRLALAELDVRQDIYSYDAAAWAYYRNGKYSEAQKMMERALALGTRDATLYYHAGMIAHALRQDVKARHYLEEALAINPHFSVLFAEEARLTLQSLQQTATK